jgi:acetoacetyl-CoA synthetase
MPDSNNTTTPQLLWKPSPELLNGSNMARYLAWMAHEKGLNFERYRDAWTWSIENIPAFWQSQWEYFEHQIHSPYSICTGGQRDAWGEWFEGATLNYAEHVFRQKTDAHPAILFQNERQPLGEMSWAELERQTAALAAHLDRNCGVQARRPGSGLPAQFAARHRRCAGMPCPSAPCGRVVRPTSAQQVWPTASCRSSPKC